MLQDFEEIEAKTRSRDECTNSTVSVLCTDKTSLPVVDLDNANKTTETDTQCVSVSTETESVTTCNETQAPVIQTEIITDPSKTAGEMKKDLIMSHVSDMDPKDLEIMLLSIENKKLKIKIERLEEQICEDRVRFINGEKHCQKILSENEKLNRSLKSQLESREEAYEALKKENTFLKATRLQVDLDYLARHTR